jgi:hypothetical protein
MHTASCAKWPQQGAAKLAVSIQSARCQLGRGHSQGERPWLDVVVEALATAADGAWILWMRLNELVVQPSFTFPYLKYTKAGKDLVLYAKDDCLPRGNSDCAFLLSSWVLEHIWAPISRLSKHGVLSCCL